jgi:hypothetical protein
VRIIATIIRISTTIITRTIGIRITSAGWRLLRRDDARECACIWQ